MRASAVLFLAAVAAVPARAAVVEYHFTATVSRIAEIPGNSNTVNDVLSSSLAGPTITTGDTWSGTLYYDTALVASTWQPTPPAEGGTYVVYEGFIGATITDAQTGLSYHADPSLAWLASVWVHDAPAGAGPDFLSIDNHASSGTGFETASFWLFDPYGSALSGATPPSAIGLGDYMFADVSYSFLQDGTDNWMKADANITSLTLVTAPVPEPATYGMLGVGLGLLAWRARSRPRG